MSFRKFGGLNYAATNNIVRSHFSNMDNSTISNTLGLLNSKIVSKSHLDLSGNSIIDVGGIYFQNGSDLIDGTYIGDLTVSGTLTVDKATYLDGSLNVSGNCMFGGTLNVSSAITTEANIYLNRNTLIPGSNNSIIWTYTNGLINTLGTITCENNKMIFSNDTYTTDGWSFVGTTQAQVFGIDNAGSIDVCGNIVMSGTTGINYLEFPDGTKQYSASGSASSTANSFIVSTQSAPCPLAGITNEYNTGGYVGQYFSNIAHSYLNLWIDFQSFPDSGISTYNDSISIEYRIYFDNCPSATTPSTTHGECSGIIKLFPKRFVSQWGTHYSGVSQSNVFNVYTGLSSYNSTNSSYAPNGRQYYCYDTTNAGSNNSDYANLYGGASYALIQFASPFSGGDYCATCSLRVLDSSLLQINPNSSANQGVKVYINYQV